MMIGLDRLVSVPTVPVSAVSGVTPTLHNHVIVITLVLRSKQTNILIDIKGMEGGGTYVPIIVYVKDVDMFKIALPSPHR